MYAADSGVVITSSPGPIPSARKAIASASVPVPTPTGTDRSSVVDCALYVDGKLSGAANQTLRLVATTHDIEIRKTGFVDFKTSEHEGGSLPAFADSEWTVGDLVIWDNRCTMHRARPFPEHEPRDVRRTTTKSDGPTAAQEAA